jgi:hypothetical protein
VYGWFLATYKVSVAVGMTGYLLLLLDMFGVGLLLARILEPGAPQCVFFVWGGGGRPRPQPHRPGRSPPCAR